MSIVSEIRHSFIGRIVRKAIQTRYHLQNPTGQPVKYRLPGGTEIELFPEGEVAEILTVQRFFERTELTQVASYLKPGMTVIDVGANIGLYSILAAKLIGGTRSVWAVEPSSESFERLTRNLKLNGCDQVRPARVALSTHANTFLKLKSDAGFGDAYRYLSLSTADDGSRDSEWVPTTTLDAFSQENGITDVAFLKIDVEGGEYRVFQGAERFLRSNSELCIMFESENDWCRRAGCTQQDSFRLLSRLGFGLYAWQKRARQWRSDEDALLRAVTVWACRDASRLPMI